MDDSHRHIPGTTTFRRHDDMCGLAVQRVAHGHELCQALPGIGRLQEGPVTVAGRTLQLDGNRGIELHNRAPVMQVTTIAFPHDGATGRRQHNLLTLR